VCTCGQCCGRLKCSSCHYGAKCFFKPIIDTPLYNVNWLHGMYQGQMREYIVEGVGTDTRMAMAMGTGRSKTGILRLSEEEDFDRILANDTRFVSGVGVGASSFDVRSLVTVYTVFGERMLGVWIAPGVVVASYHRAWGPPVRVVVGDSLCEIPVTEYKNAGKLCFVSVNDAHFVPDVRVVVGKSPVVAPIGRLGGMHGGVPMRTVYSPVALTTFDIYAGSLPMQCRYGFVIDRESVITGVIGSVGLSYFHVIPLTEKDVADIRYVQAFGAAVFEQLVDRPSDLFAMEFSTGYLENFTVEHDVALSAIW